MFNSRLRTEASHNTYWTLTNSVACFALPSIWQSKQSADCSWRLTFMASPFRDLYKCKHCCLHLLLQCCLGFIYLFTISFYADVCCHIKQYLCMCTITFALVVFVVVALFTCLQFFMLVFVVILRSALICKQVHCFCSFSL